MWREVGFRVVGHLTFIKRYASTERFLRYQHENAYLLAKGYRRRTVEREANLEDVFLDLTGHELREA